MVVTKTPGTPTLTTLVMLISTLFGFCSRNMFNSEVCAIRYAGTIAAGHYVVLAGIADSFGSFVVRRGFALPGADGLTRNYTLYRRHSTGIVILA